VRKLMRLNARELAALATACRLLALARLDLARRPVRLVLEELSSPPSQLAMPEQQAKLVSWAIAAAATRVPWRADCLIRAMAAARWLRRGGTGWKLSIGVRREPGGRLSAHAWLESGRHIVTGDLPDLETFRPIPLDEFGKLNLPLD
jgi:hypothetical protein